VISYLLISVLWVLDSQGQKFMKFFRSWTFTKSLGDITCALVPRLLLLLCSGSCYFPIDTSKTVPFLAGLLPGYPQSTSTSFNLFDNSTDLLSFLAKDGFQYKSGSSTKGPMISMAAPGVSGDWLMALAGQSAVHQVLTSGHSILGIRSTTSSSSKELRRQHRLMSSVAGPLQGSIGD
jgi:hypothetical protein